MSAQTWYYLQTDTHHGPYSWEELCALRRGGIIDDDTLIAQDGGREWTQFLSALTIRSNVSFMVTDQPNKSRVRYQGFYLMLGLLFGGTGIHHLYAGYYDRAFWQFLLSCVIIFVGWLAMDPEGFGAAPLIVGLGLNMVFVIYGIMTTSKDANGVTML